MFAIRPTTRADCEAFYGKALPYRIKAYTGLIDDEVVAIGGLGFPPDGPAIGFADMKDVARQWPYAVELHRFARKVIAEAKAAGVPLTVNRVGSMWTAFFTDQPVFDYASAKKADTARFGKFYHSLLDQGLLVKGGRRACAPTAGRRDIIDLSARS